MEVVSDSFVTSWAVACQAPLSVGYWTGLTFPSLGGLPDPGIEPVSALEGGFFTLSH